MFFKKAEVITCCCSFSLAIFQIAVIAGVSWTSAHFIDDDDDDDPNITKISLKTRKFACLNVFTVEFKLIFQSERST